MRSASFFILSVTLHAAALVYPVTFGARNHVEAISVTILPVEPESSGGAGSGGSGGSAPRSVSVSSFATRPAVATSVESKTVTNPDRQTLTSETVTTFGNGGIAHVSDISHTTDNVGTAISGAAGADANGSGDGLGGIGDGNGFGSSGIGPGRGSGSGVGAGLSSSSVVLLQARYHDTPRPNYPESARREGREGRVLLRVLVDDQGRSKRVEINSSSGSEALDRAATEAIKLWRFHPARAGDRSIESWVSIPIEFQLTDLKN